MKARTTVRMRRGVSWLAAALFGLLLAAPVGAAELPDLLQQLDTRNFRTKMDVAEQIAATGHPRAAAVLSALQNGDLYVHKPDGRLVIQRDRGPVVEAASGEVLVGPGKRDKVVVNILMRRQLQPIIARLRLASEDPAERLAAAEAMQGELDPDDVDMIKGRLEVEEDPRVRDALQVAAALALLDSGDQAQQLEAVEALSGSLLNAARNALRGAADDDGRPEVVQKAAGEALASVQSRIRFYNTLEQVFFGLSLGSVLLLAAIGLAITFGVMGVINMAHGEFLMLGAYTTFVVQQLMPDYVGLSVFVALPAAFLVAGAVGVALERGVIRFLYGRPLETLLATFGVSLFLQQLVRTIFSPLNRSVTTPEWMSGSIVINPVLSLTMNRLVIIAFALLVFLGLVLIMKRTTLGLKVRAVAQNRSMARAMGVRGEWVDAMTFGLGAGIAGIGGVALSQITNVGPNLGQSYIVDSFLVVVFGGVGNLLGTLTAALSLGVANKFLEPVTGAVLAKVVVLVFIILFIQKRPQGLFPQRGRAAEG